MTINAPRRAASDPEPSDPESTSDEVFLRSLIHHAILAPSGHNTQPWLFRIHDDRLDLFADRTRALPVVDPFDRELVISCGAALGHLETAARYRGHALVIDVLPDADDADHLATVRVGAAVKRREEDAAMFTAILRRRTTRRPYDNRRLPPDLSSRCKALAHASGVALTLITDIETRTAIGDLVAEGDRTQFADAHFRRELAAWIHSRRTASHDGMSGENFGMPDMLSPLGAAIVRTFDLGKGVAAGDRDKIVDGSPTLAIFSTEDNIPEVWLKTGRALSDVLLALTADDVTASFLNQPIEVTGLRPRLADAAGISGVPQLLMRVGYGETGRPTVRRSVEEVMLPAASA